MLLLPLSPLPCSNYGRRTVQLAAPGTDILSTNRPGYRSRLANCTLTDLYCTVTGTSEAAPFVAGAAALAKAASNRRLTNVQARLCCRAGAMRLLCPIHT